MPHTNSSQLTLLKLYFQSRPVSSLLCSYHFTLISNFINIYCLDELSIQPHTLKLKFVLSFSKQLDLFLVKKSVFIFSKTTAPLFCLLQLFHNIFNIPATVPHHLWTKIILYLAQYDLTHHQSLLKTTKSL